MELSRLFSPRRWRFRHEKPEEQEPVQDGREPDATIDEVGSAPPGGLTSGHGSGNSSSGGWAGGGF